MKRVALTGGIATGKSYVRRQFEALGVPTLDADTLARDAVAPGTPGLDAVVRRFGAGVIDSSGTLDRARLAAIVFADPEARIALERIIHPVVQRATDGWFQSLDPASHVLAIADIPLLYEVGRDKDFDLVIVTACAPEAQVARNVARGITEADARRRLAAQWPLDEKVARADFVIHTDGSHEETDQQVMDVLHRLSVPAD